MKRESFAFRNEERLKFQFCLILQWSTWRWNYELDIYILILRYHFHYASFIAQLTKMRRRKTVANYEPEKHKFRDWENALMCTFPSNRIIMMRAERIMFCKTFSLQLLSLVEVLNFFIHIRLELNARTNSQRRKCMKCRISFLLMLRNGCKLHKLNLHLVPVFKA